jgi:hypothetical protein
MHRRLPRTRVDDGFFATATGLPRIGTNWSGSCDASRLGLDISIGVRG